MPLYLYLQPVMADMFQEIRAFLEDYFVNNVTINKQQNQGTNCFTVNFLNIQTPDKFVVITLKFELCGSTIEEWVQPMQT